ncbi:hypothetical protein RvY_11206-2 [Ramazzottius varieornatus]|nr:hypothetical protein RvY_11206-2 [Ramazzottius varieornatus]
MFQCKFPGAPLTPYNVQWANECSAEESYERTGAFSLDMEGQLQFVSDAVMAFVHALILMHQDKCGGKPGICEDMNPNDGPLLLRYLRRVKFTGITGDEFEFDQNGDGPARYNILHFRKVSVYPPSYDWVSVGQYNKSGLMLDWSQIHFADRDTGNERVPESVCGRPCGFGQAKSINPEEKCCWTCANCTVYQYLASEFECLDCPLGWLPYPNKTACYEVAITYLGMDSYWAVGVLSLACLGMALTALVLVVFLKYSETNVVKAAGRELSYVLLVGIMSCYAMTGLLLLKPMDVICGFQMFSIGVCFAVCYAALMTKTNRISRIFEAAKHTAKRPTFISPRSQLIICFGLVIVQVIIMVLYMAYSPPIAEFYYPSREERMLVCRSHVDASYMVSFAYPILLVIICTIYAVKTRKIPEAFNESQYIGFTMYTTCIIWLAFVPIFFSTATNIPLRITTLCASISLSGTVSLVCLFAPKLYIILLRPERNVRPSLMPAKYLVKTNTTSMTSGTSDSNSQTSAPLNLHSTPVIAPKIEKNNINANSKALTNLSKNLQTGNHNSSPAANKLPEEKKMPLQKKTDDKEEAANSGLRHLGSFSSNVSRVSIGSNVSSNLSYSVDSLPSIDKESLDDVQL